MNKKVTLRAILFFSLIFVGIYTLRLLTSILDEQAIMFNIFGLLTVIFTSLSAHSHFEEIGLT